MPLHNPTPTPTWRCLAQRRREQERLPQFCLPGSLLQGWCAVGPAVQMLRISLSPATFCPLFPSILNPSLLPPPTFSFHPFLSPPGAHSTAQVRVASRNNSKHCTVPHAPGGDFVLESQTGPLTPIFPQKLVCSKSALRSVSQHVVRKTRQCNVTWGCVHFDQP